MVFGVTGGGRNEPEDFTLNKYSLCFGYQELQKATDNFAESRRMGEGGFGTVYRGEQPDGTEVAVKALTTPKESGFEEEVRVLSMFRHPNLVTLMGFARNGSQRFLVYELMEGGDLFNRIYDSRKGRKDFPWRDRLCVAFDAACGLSHLHFQTPKVFHRDIKSMNILLSRNGTAKVADFGLATISKKRGAHRTGSLAGTPGYMCPIYEKTCVITERSEVFSFGVVLLELLTGRYACWQEVGEKAYRFLYKELRDLDQVATSMDKSAKWTRLAFAETGKLALVCVDPKDEERRPDFTELVRLLRGMRDLPEKDSAEAITPRTPSPKKGHGNTFEKPLLWYLQCIWAEDKPVPSISSNIIKWRAEAMGHPIKLRGMSFGRVDHEQLLSPILGDQLLKCISRQAFCIEAKADEKAAATETETSAWGKRVPCTFQIHNTGKNGIAVGSGQRCTVVMSNEIFPLRDGDRIILCYCEDPGAKVAKWVPFLIFNFCLNDPEDSSLCAALRDTAPKTMGYAPGAKGGYVELPATGGMSPGGYARA